METVAGGDGGTEGQDAGAMSATMTVNVLKDTATPMLHDITLIASHPETRAEMARRCVELTSNHVAALGPNKQGWPSTGFYKAVAGNVKSVDSQGEFSVLVDHPQKRGSMRQRYHGGTIHMKDKLLTIPARQEFSGRKATDFSDLRFVMFASETKALVIGKKGAGLVNFATGKSSNPRGAGARERGMVAYWLKEEVTQDADHGVIPTEQQYQNQCINVLLSAVEQLKGAKG